MERLLEVGKKILAQVSYLRAFVSFLGACENLFGVFVNFLGEFVEFEGALLKFLRVFERNFSERFREIFENV